MEKELKCPKCGSEKRVKSGYNNKRQRYLCKKCGCHYTVGQRGYPEHIKRKAIQLHLGGNGFRRSERILNVSHVPVINWIKTAGAKLDKVPKKDKNVEVFELDKLCVKKPLAQNRSRPRHKAACRRSDRYSRNKIPPKTLE